MEEFMSLFNWKEFDLARGFCKGFILNTALLQCFKSLHL